MVDGTHSNVENLSHSSLGRLDELIDNKPSEIVELYAVPMSSIVKLCKEISICCQILGRKAVDHRRIMWIDKTL